MLSDNGKSNRSHQRGANPAPRRAERGSSAAGGGAVGAARRSRLPAPAEAERPELRPARCGRFAEANERFSLEAARREDGRRSGACRAGAAEGTPRRRAEGTRRRGRPGGSVPIASGEVRRGRGGGLFSPRLSAAFARGAAPGRPFPPRGSIAAMERGGAGPPSGVRCRSAAFRPRGWALGGEKGIERVPPRPALPGGRCRPSPAPAGLFVPPSNPGRSRRAPRPEAGAERCGGRASPRPAGRSARRQPRWWRGGTHECNSPWKDGSSTSRYLTPGCGRRGELAVPGAAAGRQTEVPALPAALTGAGFPIHRHCINPHSGIGNFSSFLTLLFVRPHFSH